MCMHALPVLRSSHYTGCHVSWRREARFRWPDRTARTGTAAGRQLRETHPTAHSPRVGDPALAGPPRLLVRSGDRLGLTSTGPRDANPRGTRE
jgi:hypothetical protein